MLLTLKEVLRVKPGEDLEERVLEAYFNMREDDVGKAKEVIEGIKAFASQI